MRRLLALATVMKWVVRFFDISRASLHTPIRDRVLLEPPPEYREFRLET